MNCKLWLQTATILTLANLAVSTNAQTPGSSPVALPLRFDAAALVGAAQELTATFSLGPDQANIVPVASLHYGHDFTVGQVSCAGATCSVNLRFAPTLPGTRPDALFLSYAGKRLATIPVSGTGQSPFALLQPAGLAPLSSAALGPAVLDENGVLYTLDAAAGSVTASDASGRATVLPVAGVTSARGLAIDGAGVLYLLPGTTDAALITFDTVQGIQGSLALPAPASTFDSIAVGSSGSLYAISSAAHLVYTLNPATRAIRSTPIENAAGSGPATSALISGESLILAGNYLQKLALSGSGSAINAQVKPQAAGSSFSVLAADAAGTLYVNSGGSLLQLPATSFDAASPSLPQALAAGSDGSLLFAGSQGLTRVDRTTTAIDFGAVVPSLAAQPQAAELYNAGNLPLTLSDVRVTGGSFSLASASATPCVGGTVLTAGSSCALSIALLAPVSGTVSGTLTVASNSLNQPGSLLSFPIRAHAAGSQAVLTPNSLTFPSTTVNIASAPLMVTLSNPGTAALNFSSIALTGAASGSYSLTQNCFSATVTSLAAGASCTLTVIFKPLTAAVQTASVSIVDDLNGNAGSTQTVTLSGLGVAAPAPIISFTAVSANGTSTSGLSFGSTANPIQAIPAGTPTPPSGTITITNTGNAVLNISTLTLILSGTSTVLPYTQTNTCGATLAVGANCVVTVLFAPPLGTGATYTASVVIVDNAAGSPQSFGISGIATTDDFTMSESTANLSIPSSGGSAQVTFTATPDPGPFPTVIQLSLFGVPAGATYNFTPNTISAITTPGTSTLTLALPTYTNVILSDLDAPSLLRRTAVPAAAFLLAGLLCFGPRRRRLPRLTAALQVVLLSIFALGAISGCSSGVPVSGGVAPGTYSLTVTATSANGNPTTVGATHQATFQLVVR